MITVPQATEKIIKRSRYLTEAMMKDLINFSSLARYIQPEVEEIVMKDVTRASIIMAIKRYAASLKKKGASTPLLADAPDMIVRSNLKLYFVKNSPTLLKKLTEFEEIILVKQKRALFSYGRAETVILTNKLASVEMSEALREENVITTIDDVSSITIHITYNAVGTPGILNIFIKSLAWEHISLLSMFVSNSELTLVLKKDDVHTAFGIFQALFEQG